MATMILASAVTEGERGYAQTIRTAGHQLAADEPERRGGTNTGPAPFELVLAGLGACTAITLRMYCDRKQWNLGTINVHLRLIKEGDAEPRIERNISTTEMVDESQRAKLLEIADKTPVSKILSSGIRLQTVFDSV